MSQKKFFSNITLKKRLRSPIQFFWKGHILETIEKYIIKIFKIKS